MPPSVDLCRFPLASSTNSALSVAVRLFTSGLKVNATVCLFQLFVAMSVVDDIV